MAEHSRFFNSTEEDRREYTAGEFAEYFSRFLINGIYPDGQNVTLEPVAGGGLDVTIGEGFAIVEGYLYKNDEPLNKALRAADSNFDRIDRVVIRLDVVARTVTVKVKEGIPASVPQAPSLENGAIIKELPLCRVRVRSRATGITAQDMTDERVVVRNAVPSAFGAQVFIGEEEPALTGVGDIWLKVTE